MENYEEYVTFLLDVPGPNRHCTFQSNILISDAGNPLLSDLGLRDLPYSEDLEVLNGNGDLDDVRWMAPELIDIPTCATTQGGCPMTCPSSDIYSFGMTALEVR